MSHSFIPVQPFDLTIFGATGDLSKRKLLPGLFHRDADGQLPKDVRVIGCARTELDDDGFRAMALEALNEHIPKDRLDNETVNRFLSRLFYVTNNIKDKKGWSDLKKILQKTPEDRITLFYLSVSPTLFGPIVEGLNSHNLAKGARLIVEKPIGRDSQSAKILNDAICSVFDEKSVYRIDHYLGKETVQNLIALRFANALFEPLWNARYIDHVQITVAESLGVGGRGAYYDQSGAMRDMVQNHILQLMCLTAMEPPHHYSADALRDEKLKVLRALKPLSGHDALTSTVRGQYRGYHDEVENPDSHTESFVAIKAEIGSWRWAGTPFYLRTGKKLRSRLSEIVIQFRETPHQIFSDLHVPTRPNSLIIRLQPNEGITLSITTKDPGPGGFRMRETPLDMSFADEATKDWRMPDAYERLVLDVVRGDQTLFMRRDEVEAAWQWVDPIIEAWEHAQQKPESYDVGGEGPYGAIDMLSKQGRRWREILA